jgi:hypothetical protein
MTASHTPAMLGYFDYLQKAPNQTEQLSAEAQQHLNIMSYCLGWANLVYAGPKSTFHFINDEPYLNPRPLNDEHVEALCLSISNRKCDFRFPIDLLVNVDDIPSELKARVNVQGLQPDIHVPDFALKGCTAEEQQLQAETWLRSSLDNGEPLTMEQYNSKMRRLHELKIRPGRPQARILGGRHRNAAMQILAAPIYEGQARLCGLVAKKRSPEEEIELDHLATTLRASLESCKFRVRIFDGKCCIGDINCY